MTADSTEKRFVKRMRELLVSLPYDLKVLFEAVSDENLPIEARQLAAGAAIYCLSPSDPIPDSLGLVGFVDDAIVVRLTLKRMLQLAGAEGASYPERFMEQFQTLDDDLTLIKDYLGESMEWLEVRLDKTLVKSRYKGKDALTYATDEEAGIFLYDAGLEFTTQYEIDDEAVAKLQNGKPIKDAFRKRMNEESRRIG
jgi:uncharacterized membrane protein YkvA (DUF1232 family)